MFRKPLASLYDPSTTLHFLSYGNSLTTAIRTARTRIWIMTYVINCNLNKAADPVTLILALLRKKLAAGIDIRIICDDPAINRPNYHCNKFMMRWFEEWGIPYCTPPAKITAHAKAVVIDSAFLFIGSHNLAKSSLENPLECTIETTSPGIISTFAAAFEVIWNDTGLVSHLPPFTHGQEEPRPWMEHKNG